MSSINQSVDENPADVYVEQENGHFWPFIPTINLCSEDEDEDENMDEDDDEDNLAQPDVQPVVEDLVQPVVQPVVEDLVQPDVQPVVEDLVQPAPRRSGRNAGKK
jgi:hypothetical protein